MILTQTATSPLLNLVSMAADADDKASDPVIMLSGQLAGEMARSAILWGDAEMVVRTVSALMEALMIERNRYITEVDVHEATRDELLDTRSILIQREQTSPVHPDPVTMAVSAR